MLKTEHYCITQENIFGHEFIGLDAEIMSGDANKNKLRGIVVDETKNTIVIEDANGSEKIVPKAEAKFLFKIGKEVAVVNGKEILYTPEQRLKALWRKSK
ncbi:MAG: ribonuclease P protein subunit [archaeon]|nr:ribonuclease P protein subunit [archaeon]